MQINAKCCWLLLVIASISLGDGPRQIGPWDLDELEKTPKFEWVESTGDVRSLYYEGELYRGKPTRIFAYYATPKDATGKVPAMVLVHGGGGKSFKEWTELWAKRGYAAIAMDLGGKGPDGKTVQPDGGPNHTHVEKFTDIKNGVTDAWTYHAVANVIRAASLIRSFPEVDPERVGITGISWGGYLTCIVSSVDSRLKVAVPVYGCGFLHENSTWLGEFEKLGSELTALWVKNFDPSQYLPLRTQPILFVNGTNDFAYPMDSYQKSYRAVKGPRWLCLTVRMPHGHQSGWAPIEIVGFVDSILGNEKPFIRFTETCRDGKKITAKTDAPGGSLKGAGIHWTTDGGPWQKREWKSAPAVISADGTIMAELPAEGSQVYFLTVKDDRGFTASSEHEVIGELPK